MRSSIESDPKEFFDQLELSVYSTTSAGHYCRRSRAFLTTPLDILSGRGGGDDEERAEDSKYVPLSTCQVRSTTNSL